MEKLKVYMICSVSLICIFLFGGLVYTAFQYDETIAVSSASTAPPVIVIDAGHGGEDSGAVDNGLLEKDINLSIALKLQDMLTVGGYKVEMIRDTDISVYDSSASTTREKKVSDLQNRVKIINASQDGKNRILVSIHQNKFEQSQYFGTQMFYSKNNARSAVLAEELRKSVTGLLQPDNKRELKQADSNIYILDKAEVPAVIVECGFLSNYEESQKLADNSYQQQMAFAIYSGILGYVNKGSVQ